MTDFPYGLERLGVVMRPDPERPFEAEGVLNPGSGRTADGRWWLLPRLVAAGNVSRVGLASVVVEPGVPVGVRHEAVVLSPDTGWERSHSHAGVEDPRVTWIPDLGVHVMAYVAFGPLGPKPALAVSGDLRSWRRLGPIHFEYAETLDTDLTMFPNKDVVVFRNRCRGRTASPRTRSCTVRCGILAWSPAGGTCICRPGWTTRGPASGSPTPRWRPGLRYAAGAMLLDPADPARVLERTATPLLTPDVAEERHGVAPNVVFPTAIEQIGDQRFVFYGMADSSIGVARLTPSSPPEP